MLLEKLFDNLALKVDPFATCRVADGWRLRLPSRDWVTLHYILLGDGGLRLASGKLLTLPSNSLAIMPPGLAHALECGSVGNETGVEGQGTDGAPLCELVAGPLQHLRLTVACGRIQAIYGHSMGLFDHLREAIVLDFSDSPQMRATFEALIEEYRRAGAGSAAMMNALMSQCLIQVLRRLGEQSNGSLPWLSALDDPRLARAFDTILTYPEKGHSIESLATIAHMSRSTFARHFEQCFGRTPMDYVRDVRLRHAAKLLQVSGLSVDAVAGKVGYGSRSHFSRVFQEHFGCSPQDFRKQQR